jgi:hypothetical protein
MLDLLFPVTETTPTCGWSEQHINKSLEELKNEPVHVSAGCFER